MGPERYFNPRAPRGARLVAEFFRNLLGLFQSTCPARGTTRCWRSIRCAGRFQSTCPARGTTLLHLFPRQETGDFNPRAPRGARPAFMNLVFKRVSISIHVPREGHDAHTLMLDPPGEQFQSTCPARGTTGGGHQRPEGHGISIHVPREGHDPLCIVPLTVPLTFQSTCPARGTTHIPQ